MVNDVSIPTSTDEAPASSEGGAGYDADDARPTFVWGENVNVCLSVFEAFPGQFHSVSVGRWVAQGREV